MLIRMRPAPRSCRLDKNRGSILSTPQSGLHYLKTECDVTLIELDKTLLSAEHNINTSASTKNVKMHSENKLFSCYTCNCQFDNTTELRLHVSQHDVPKAFKCGLCGLSFLDQTSLSEHLNEIHHDLPLLYKCSRCDVPFKDVSALSQHITETHSTASAKYECGVCGKTFTQAARLKAHAPCNIQQSTQRTRSSIAVIRSDGNKISDMDDEEKNVSRKSKSGKRKEQISQVKKKKVPRWLSLRKIETKKGSLFVKKQKLKAKAVTICRKYEENQRQKISHTGRSDYLSGFYSVDCGNCKKCFNSESLLKKHIENSDCGGYKCSLCSKKYHVEVLLLKHMVKHMIDSGTVELKCLQCSKAFDTEQKLIRHSVVHSQSSPFLCKLCGNRFSLSENIFKHLKRMHGHVVSNQSDHMVPTLALPNSSSLSVKSDSKKSDVDQNDSFNSSDSEVEDQESRDDSSNRLLAEHKLDMDNRDESTQNLYFIDCAKCLTSFESLDLLFKHSKESDCEGFQCPSCPQSFELETSYLRHRAKHKVDKDNTNFKCENCLRQFKSVHQFIKHSEIHAVSTPFVCRLCLCRFSSSDNLFNHLKSDHGHKLRINFAKTKSDLLCTSEEHEDKDQQIARADFEDSRRELSELKHSDDIQFFSNDRRCQDCGKIFETPRGLACHRNWNSIEGIYSVDCDECHASFESLNLLSYHLRTSACQGYQCTLCPQVFELESSFLRHVAKHQTDNALLALGEGTQDFKCEHCSKTFSSAPQYLRHSRNHAKSTPFRCNICSNRFTHIELLHKHAKGKHKVKISSCPDIGTQPPSENGKVLKERTGLNPVLCCRCQGTFNSVDAVVEHVKISSCHGFVCDSCGQTLASQEDLVCHEVTEHIIHMANGNLQCFKCFEIMESVADYMRHSEIHFDFLAFQCTLCSLKFISADCLKDHLTENHSEVESSSRRSISNFKHKRRIGGACKICKKVFHSIISLKAHEANHRRIRCIPCGKIFTHRSELLQHRRSIHSEPVSFRCTVCSKTLSSVNNLRRHERLHTGEKPFQCQFCAKMFACSDSIRSHLRTHSSEKPFKCTICSYSCKFKSGLNRHIMTHNANLERNHVCPTCGKSFRTRHNMLQHCKLHGKKSYQCSVCGAAFARKDYLDIHSRVHTMDKPYSCPVCYQSFAVTSNMNSHVRRIHPDYFLQSRMKASEKISSSTQQALDVTKALVEEPDEIHGLLNSVQNAFSYHQMY